MKNSLLDIVPEYRSRFPIVRKLFVSRVIQSLNLAKIKPGYNILDAGCGEGLLLKKASSTKGIKLYGFDHNPQIKNLKVPNVQLKYADLNKSLPYEDNYFDRVFCLDTLEHIKDITNALSEFKRIMKPGALLIISGPTESWFYKSGRFLLKGTFSEEAGPASSPHFHNINSLKEVIQKNGFKCAKVKNIPPIPALVLFKLLVFKKDEIYR